MGHVPLHMPMDLFGSEISALSEAFGSAPIPEHRVLSIGVRDLAMNRNHQPLAEAINSIVSELVLRSGRDFVWSGLQMGRGLTADWHVDDVAGDALLVLCGSQVAARVEFSGGHVVSLSQQAMFFVPASCHRLLSLDTARLSVVAYWDADADIADSEGRELLTAAGFWTSKKDRPSREAPRRACIDDVAMDDSGILYIGRGHRGRGLARSDWANPFPILPGMPRGRVIKRFKFYLSRSPALVNRLHELGGKVLACHCPRGLPCHGDILIEAYRDRFLAAAMVPPSDAQVGATRDARITQAVAGGHVAHRPAPTDPTRQLGVGDPARVEKGGARRLLVDGGGLCSPGLWPPSRRAPPTPRGEAVRRQLEGALAESGFSMDIFPARDREVSQRVPLHGVGDPRGESGLGVDRQGPH